MLLKLGTQLKDLANNELEDFTVGKTLGNIVICVKSDPLRAYVMAQKLFTSDEIELSQADFEYIKTAVKEHGKDAYGNALIPGQLMIILGDFK
jgi:hypothetical protein